MDKYEILYKRGLIDSKEYEKIKVVDLDLALETKLEREFKAFKKDLKKLPKNKIIDKAYEISKDVIVVLRDQEIMSLWVKVGENKGI